jgi:uncharacterized protein (TIGR02145 family)
MKKIIFFLFIAVSSIGKSQTVTIGKQIWSSKNLDVEYFRNGDPIPQAKTCEEWKLASENKKPIWCYYFFDPNNGKLYGKLYNWYAVNDPRGLAPIGWHIPEYSEWKQLIDYLGGYYYAGRKMKSSYGWSLGGDGNGTNESGFSGLPGGTVNYDGTFYAKDLGKWWSSTSNRNFDAWICILGLSEGRASTNYYDKRCGLSVRCIKNH